MTVRESDGLSIHFQAWRDPEALWRQVDTFRNHGFNSAQSAIGEAGASSVDSPPQAPSRVANPISGQDRIVFRKQAWMMAILVLIFLAAIITLAVCGAKGMLTVPMPDGRYVRG